MHIPTADNPADVLTKALEFDSFARHTRSLIGLVSAVRALPRGVMAVIREWGPRAYRRASVPVRRASMCAPRVFS